jgi:alkaline phosphatase D
MIRTFFLFPFLLFSRVHAQNPDVPFCGTVNHGLEPVSVSKIGFGSCADQNAPYPVLVKMKERNPDVFCWLGDNIYGDSHSMKVLREKYTKLGCHEEFRKLNESTFFLAVWDDHDYGKNDGGKFYSKKEDSKQLFLEFWNEQSEDRFAHKGIYHSKTVGKDGQRVQFIMLDTRTFRDPLRLNLGGHLFKIKKKWKNDYIPIQRRSATFLGKEQWGWLEGVLKEPADIRIVMSSSQFGISYNGYEAWANMPREREKFISVIQKTKANGIIFISGDVHWAEISKINIENGYPLYDITSSGITQDWSHIEPNDNRVGEAFPSNNAGLIEIDWNQPDPLVQFKIIDVKGNEVLTHQIRLSELSFP